MKGLYKGKYLIAVYDEEDILIDVANELKQSLKYNSYYLSRLANNKISNANSKYKVRVLDAITIHDDIFAEEDRLFLEFIKEEYKPSARTEAERLGVSVRTYFRHILDTRQKVLYINLRKSKIAKEIKDSE